MTGFKWKHLQHCKIPEVIASRTSLSNFLVRFFEPFIFRKETQSCLTSPLSVSLAPRKKLLLHCSAYSSISVYHFSQSSSCLLGLLGYPPAHFTKLFHIAAYSSSPHLTSKAPLVLLCSTAYCLSQESKKQEKCEGMIQGKRKNWLCKQIHITVSTHAKYCLRNLSSAYQCPWQRGQQAHRPTSPNGEGGVNCLQADSAQFFN